MAGDCAFACKGRAAAQQQPASAIASGRGVSASGHGAAACQRAGHRLGARRAGEPSLTAL